VGDLKGGSLMDFKIISLLIEDTPKFVKLIEDVEVLVENTKDPHQKKFAFGDCGYTGRNNTKTSKRVKRFRRDRIKENAMKEKAILEKIFVSQDNQDIRSKIKALIGNDIPSIIEAWANYIGYQTLYNNDITELLLKANILDDEFAKFL